MLTGFRRGRYDYVATHLILLGSERDIWRQNLAGRYWIAKTYNLQTPSVKGSGDFTYVNIYMQHVA